MPIKIFFCYAHKDEALLRKLKAHLRSSERQGLIEFWHDRDISAGMPWKREIINHLNEAQIILLLISSDFMDSDFCYGNEMRRAVERHTRGEANVIPIILRPVHWKEEPLDKLQALPIDGKPVTGPKWHSVDQAFYDIAEGIIKVVKQLSPEVEPEQAPTPRVIDTLRTAIARGTFESGTPLKETPLAKQYNVTPEVVHEALMVLEAEGLIQHFPDRGYVVYTVTLADAEDIYQTREVLEGLASRLFTERATANQVTQLEKAIDTFAEAAKNPDQKDILLNAKNQVYEVLLEGSGNSVVYSLLQSLRDRISYLRKQTLSHSGRPEHTLKELRNILEAIKEGNAEKAEQASIVHVRKAASVAYTELQRRNKSQLGI
jgi:DNA-binding GntR family transcriptional regulator